jgi:hypothetical protein
MKICKNKYELKQKSIISRWKAGEQKKDTFHSDQNTRTEKP